MSNTDLTAKIRELKDLKAMAEELAEEICTIEDELKNHMTEQNLEEMTVGIFKVKYTTVQSNRFDSAAFKRTHADMYSQYSKQITTKRFVIA